MIQWKEKIKRQIKENHDDDSHVERNSYTFHPSQVSRCPRQCTIQKLGLEDHGINTLWNFYLGTRQHEDLREWLEGTIPGVEFEVELSEWFEIDDDGVKLTGRADVIDHLDGVVYDFKTRKSFQHFNGASDAHKDQITAYMKLAGVDQAQLVYLVKSAPWDEDKPIVRTRPENGYYEFDEDRWRAILEKAKLIFKELELFRTDHARLPESVEEVPFDKCGCWLCEGETDD